MHFTALGFLCLGICLVYLGAKLNKGDNSNESKKEFADYHGEVTLVGIVFLIMSFVSFVYWLWLHLIVAK